MNVRNRILKSALLAGAALCCTNALALSPADPARITRSETVKYRPSEVATTEGAMQLYGQLKAAAVRVCENPSPLAERSFGADPSRRTCVEEALTQAVRDVAVPLVSAMHRYGGQVPAMAASR